MAIAAAMKGKGSETFGPIGPWLVTVHNQAKFVLLAKRTEEPAARPAPRCPSCGGPMVILQFVPALAPFDTS